MQWLAIFNTREGCQVSRQFDSYEEAYEAVKDLHKYKIYKLHEERNDYLKGK